MKVYETGVQVRQSRLWENLKNYRPSCSNMFAKKFEEFALQDNMKIGMTSIEKITEDPTQTHSARASLSSEVSGDSALLPYYLNGAVSAQAAKMFAFAKTLEFARSAHVLSMMRSASAEGESKEEDPERKSEGQNESNDESGIGSEKSPDRKSGGSPERDEDIMIGETKEEELAQTGKKLVI